MNNDMNNRRNMNDNANAEVNAFEMNDGAYVYLTGEVTEMNGDMAMVGDNNTTYKVDLSELGYDALMTKVCKRLRPAMSLSLWWGRGRIFSDKKIVADGIIEMRARDASMMTKFWFIHRNQTDNNNNIAYLLQL